MSEDNGNIYEGVSPEAAVAVFAKNARGHLCEAQDGNIRRYTVKAADGNTYSVSLEIKAAVNDKPMVVFTLYTGLYTFNNSALALEVCRANTVISSGKLFAPIISLCEERGEVTISKALALDSKVVKELSNCELDCIALSNCLEKYLDNACRALIPHKHKSTEQEAIGCR